MKWFKQKLEEQELLFFIITATLSTCLIGTNIFSEQLLLWGTTAISVVLTILLTINIVTYSQILKDRYLNSMKEIKLFIENEILGAKNEVNERLQIAENKNLVSMGEIKENFHELKQKNIEDLSKLEQQIDKLETNISSTVKEELLLLNEKIVELDTKQLQLVEEYKERIKQSYSQFRNELSNDLELISSNTKEVTQNIQENLQKNTSELLYIIEGKSELLSGINHQSTNKVVAQTKETEKLLMEILSTLAKNILTSSELIKETANQQHLQLVDKINSVDSQHQRLEINNHQILKEVLLSQGIELLNAVKLVEESDKEHTEQVVKALEKHALLVKENILTKLEKDGLLNQEEKQKQTNILKDRLDNVLKSISETAISLDNINDQHAQSNEHNHQAIVELLDVQKENVEKIELKQEENYHQLKESFITHATNLLDAIEEIENSDKKNTQLLMEQSTSQGTLVKESILKSVGDNIAILQSVLGDKFSQLFEEGIKRHEQVVSKQEQGASTVATTMNSMMQKIQLLSEEQSNDLNSNVQNIIEILDKHQISLNDTILNIPSEQQKQTGNVLNEMTKQYSKHAEEIKVVKEQQVIQFGEIRNQIANSAKNQEQTIQHFISQNQSEMLDSLEQMYKLSNKPLQLISEKVKQMQDSSTQVNSKTLQDIEKINKELKVVETGLLNKLQSLFNKVDKQDMSIIESNLNQVKIKLENIINTNEDKSNVAELVYGLKEQLEEQELLLFKRIKRIEEHLSEFQKITKLNMLNQISDTKEREASKQGQNKKVKEENRTEIIEDKVNKLKIHNQFIKNKLSKSDMYQNGKITYSVVYTEKGEKDTTFNYDDKGNLVTEIKYYPSGAMKERIENTKIDGKTQRKITKFDKNGISIR